MNMNGVWNLGRGLEEEFGFWRVAVIYCVSGLSGVLGSSVFIPEIIGVGASGALYGLVGALLADFVQNHKTIDSAYRSPFRFALTETALLTRFRFDLFFRQTSGHTSFA